MLSGKNNQQMAICSGSLLQTNPPNNGRCQLGTIIHYGPLEVYKKCLAIQKPDCHCSDLEESAKIALATLSAEVTTHYRTFKTDTNYVLPRHVHLFTQWSLQQLLTLSYDYITWWVWSVKETRSMPNIPTLLLTISIEQIAIFSLLSFYDWHVTLTNTNGNENTPCQSYKENTS
jgi:hypothetical protein